MYSRAKSALDYMNSLESKFKLYMKVGHRKERASTKTIDDETKVAISMLNNGLSYTTVAEKMGINRSTLVSRVSRRKSSLGLTKVSPKSKTTELVHSESVH